jgi:hypothetical protein
MSADEHTLLFCDLIGLTALADAGVSHEGDAFGRAVNVASRLCRSGLAERLRLTSCPLCPDRSSHAMIGGAA